MDPKNNLPHIFTNDGEIGEMNVSKIRLVDAGLLNNKGYIQSLNVHDVIQEFSKKGTPLADKDVAALEALPDQLKSKEPGVAKSAASWALAFASRVGSKVLEEATKAWLKANGHWPL